MLTQSDTLQKPKSQYFMDFIIPSESNILHVLGHFSETISPDSAWRICQVSLVILGFQLVFKIEFELLIDVWIHSTSL